MPEPEQPKKKPGRPKGTGKKRVELDYDLIAALAAEGWTQKDIAKKVDLSEEQFSRRLKWDTRLMEILLTGEGPLNYDVVGLMSAAQCTHEEIANALGISKSQFNNRLQDDVALQDAVNGNYSKGVANARRAMYRAMMDRRMTICLDCQKIKEGEFRASCPYCDQKEEDPERTGPNGAHTNVKHKFINGNVALMIFWMKNYGGMVDKVEHSGDPKNPMHMDLNLTIETPKQRLARYKNYFESLEDGANRGADPISGRDNPG